MEPQPSTTISSPVDIPPPAQTGGLKNKLVNKKILILIVLIVLVSAGVVFFVLGQRKSENKYIKNEAIIAQVGKDTIYKNDVVKAAEKQYSKNAITDEVLKKTEDRLIEEKILYQEAAKLGVQISDEEAISYFRGQFPQAKPKPEEDNIDKIKVTLLRQAVTSKVVTSRTGFSVGYWTLSGSEFDSLAEASKAAVLKQRDVAKDFLIEVEETIRRGEDPIDAAKELAEGEDDYSLAKEIIAVNGILIDKGTNPHLHKYPKVYLPSDKSVLGTRYFEALFGLHDDEITIVFEDNYTSGTLFKVVESTDSEYSSYKDWLEAKKKELVKR